MKEIEKKRADDSDGFLMCQTDRIGIDTAERWKARVDSDDWKVSEILWLVRVVRRFYYSWDLKNGTAGAHRGGGDFFCVVCYSDAVSLKEREFRIEVSEGKLSKKLEKVMD